MHEMIQEQTAAAGNAVTLLKNWAAENQTVLPEAAVGIMLSLLAAWLIVIVVKIIWSHAAHAAQSILSLEIGKSLLRPMFWVLTAIGIRGSLRILHFSSGVEAFLDKTYGLTLGLLLLWAALSTLGGVDRYFKQIPEAAADSSLNNLLAVLIRRVVKVTFWIIAVLFIAQNVFNLNIGAMLAGAGVLGLAIAFAAQSTIANIFGAVSIILGKPFVMGDRIVVGGKDGVVTGIGLRCTRLRSLDGTVWNIPNREMGDSPILNLSKRPNFKETFEVGLVYSTSAADMRRAEELLHSILDGDPLFDMKNQPPKIAFSNMAASSLNLTAIVWFQTTDWFEMVAAKERIYYKILEQFNAAGLSFAYPSQSIYIEKK